jgi:hypothetical protein
LPRQGAGKPPSAWHRQLIHDLSPRSRHSSTPLLGQIHISQPSADSYTSVKIVYRRMYSRTLSVYTCTHQGHCPRHNVLFPCKNGMRGGPQSWHCQMNKKKQP